MSTNLVGRQVGSRVNATAGNFSDTVAKRLSPNCDVRQTGPSQNESCNITLSTPSTKMQLVCLTHCGLYRVGQRFRESSFREASHTIDDFAVSIENDHGRKAIHSKKFA